MQWKVNCCQSSTRVINLAITCLVTIVTRDSMNISQIIINGDLQLKLNLEKFKQILIYYKRLNFKKLLFE